MRYILGTITLIGCIIGMYFLQIRIERNSAIKRAELSKETITGSQTYMINKPDRTLTLTADLQEISGLGYVPESDALLAIQDENGILYYLDKQTGAVTKTTKFGKDDDYEGVTANGQLVYIMTSKGELDEIQETNQVVVYDTDLKKSFDLEGLTFLSHGNRLLLASKASGPKTKSYLRKVFSFDLDEKKLIDKPLLTLDCREIAEKLQVSKGASYFSPSAICPDSNHDLFILSSVADAIIVVDTLGTIKSVAQLDPSLHLQPEGIVIDDQGILYIANEGRTSTAKIYVFNPKT